MTTEERKALLIEFLTKHNALDAYKNNLSQDVIHSKLTFNTAITKLVDNVRPEMVFSIAFVWHTSPEGRKYWSSIVVSWITMFK